jgi:microcystin-dependent protein
MKKRFVRISIYVLVTLAITFAVSFANADDATSFTPTAVTVKAAPTGLAIGSVVAWPRSSVPKNYLRCNGQSFSTSSYPKLYKALGNNRVPNYDGEFLRGAGNGRGSVGSTQGDAIRNISGEFWAGKFNSKTSTDERTYVINDAEGAFSISGSSRGGWGSQSAWHSSSTKKIRFSADSQVPTADENRPRNIAVMYIIRAK